MEIVSELFDGLELSGDMKAICIMFTISILTLIIGLLFDMIK